jgi:hypothetical protein
MAPTAALRRSGGREPGPFPVLDLVHDAVGEIDAGAANGHHPGGIAFLADPAASDDALRGATDHGDLATQHVAEALEEPALIVVHRQVRHDQRRPLSKRFQELLGQAPARLPGVRGTRHEARGGYGHCRVLTDSHDSASDDRLPTTIYGWK